MCVNVQETRGNRCKVLKNHLERTRLHFHNLQISDYPYVEKVFENLRQKLRLGSYVLDEKTATNTTLKPLPQNLL